MNAEIVRLAEMTCARFHALSASPEEEAWRLLETWAGPQGLLDASSTSKIFGFNNPDPSAGSPNYGYEFWITVEGVTADIKIVHFTGGRYATVPYESDTPHELPKAWKALVDWAEESEHLLGTHQWLEGHSLRGMPNRLYLPVK